VAIYGPGNSGISRNLEGPTVLQCEELPIVVTPKDLAIVLETEVCSMILEMQSPAYGPGFGAVPVHDLEQ